MSGTLMKKISYFEKFRCRQIHYVKREKIFRRKNMDFWSVRWWTFFRNGGHFLDILTCPSNSPTFSHSVSTKFEDNYEEPVAKQTRFPKRPFLRSFYPQGFKKNLTRKVWESRLVGWSVVGLLFGRSPGFGRFYLRILCNSALLNVPEKNLASLIVLFTSVLSS